MAEFTRTQQAMLDILSDGMSHTRAELQACRGPSSVESLSHHISKIRKILNLKGEDVACTFVSRRICYRWVRLLASPNNG